MRNRIFGLIVVAVLGLFQLSARAEDIDLFSGTSADQNAPNMLLILDNGANFSSNASGTSCIIDGVHTALSGTAGGVEQCALYSVIEGLDLSSGAVPVKLGVMVFNGNNILDFEGRACPAGGNGGCLVYPLTGLSAETRPALLNWIKRWHSSGGGYGYIKGPNSGQNGAVMQEAWAYLNGRMGLSGREYEAIAPDTACKNFVVFVGNAYSSSGQPGDSTGDVGPKNALEGLNFTGGGRKNAFPPATSAQKALLRITNSPTPAATSCGTFNNFPGDNNHENRGLYADEWTRYMHANRITTFTVGFLGDACQASYAWLLSSMANAGGGTYFPTRNYAELVRALQTILSEVRSVNSVFAAVSLPISVNSQGTYLNQVFVGMFRPDTNGFPRWLGNLKQYKMGFLPSSGAFSLLDADDRLAISASGSEFLAECARSYWTPSATAEGDGYWITMTDPNCIGYPASSNSPDGNLVEKGGQAFRLRGMSPASRVVKTCAAGVSNCTTLTDFSTTNTAITAGGLGIPTGSAVDRDTLINWARGSNNHLTSPERANINGALITASNMRPSSHGDVVHSRPAAVNFGTDANPRVVVFYGGNDGMLRAINGNRSVAFTAAGRSVPAGGEFWSFVPPEFHDKLLRRYTNDADGVIGEANRKDYAMDGPITALRRPNGDAWLFVSLRRGGNALYAFKVDGATLDVSLMWKRGCFGDTNCDTTAAFNQMGQTWSAPQVFLARNTGASKPLLIMGGGYDRCEDVLPNTCSTSPKGKQFYVLEADTGLPVKTFSTARPVIADVTIVPDSEGYAKYIYGADLGGNVYRISGPTGSGGDHTPIGENAASSWMIKTVASLGCDTAQTCTTPPNRKFMFAPDVVLDGSTYWLLLGSGDREKPTRVGNPISNYFFAIKDRPDLGDSHLNDAACTTFPGLCLEALHRISQGTSATPDEVAAKKGWYLALHGDEQVVTGAIAVFGTVYFTTHQPTPAASTACVPNLGKARSYAVKYSTGANARSTADAYLLREDGGLAPDLVVGKVTLDDGTVVPFCIGCDGPIKPSQPIAPTLITNPAKIRSYWYIQK